MAAWLQLVERWLNGLNGGAMTLGETEANDGRFFRFRWSISEIVGKCFIEYKDLHLNQESGTGSW